MASSRRLTLEQFLARPETKPGREYVCGEVWIKPMGTRAHKAVQHLLSIAFGLFLRQHPIGEAGPEWRFIFGPPGKERAWLPDFAFVISARVADDDYNSPHRGPPDLAVEVLSPRDRAGRVTEKVVSYLQHGVRLVWLIDPRQRTLRVFAPGQDTRTLHEDDILDGGDVLPGFSVRVADVLPPAPATGPRR